MDGVTGRADVIPRDFGGVRKTAQTLLDGLLQARPIQRGQGEVVISNRHEHGLHGFHVVGDDEELDAHEHSTFCHIHFDGALTVLGQGHPGEPRQFIRRRFAVLAESSASCFGIDAPGTQDGFRPIR
jgi:hypothetical protein